MKRHVEVLIKDTSIQKVKKFVTINGGHFYDFPEGFGGHFVQTSNNDDKVVWIEFNEIKSSNEFDIQVYFTVYNRKLSRRFMLALLEKLSNEFQVSYAQTTFGIIFPLQDLFANRFRFVYDYYEDFEFSLLSAESSYFDVKNVLDNASLGLYTINLSEERGYLSSLIKVAGGLDSYLNNYVISLKEIYLQDIFKLLEGFNSAGFLFWGFNLFHLKGNDFKLIAANETFDFY